MPKGSSVLRFFHLPSWWRMICLVTLAAAMASCGSIKKFMSNDLASDEDFIIGQLYEDEYVKESPYVPATKAGDKTKEKTLATSNKSSAAAALAALRTSDDDGALYEALMPWMGTPYKYGGETKSGVDCSGFVGQIIKTRYGIKMHRTANDMQQDVTMIGRNQLRAGDILFFSNSKGKVSHVGIFLKDGVFVHSSTSNGVSLSRFDTGYWAQHFYKCGRVKK